MAAENGAGGTLSNETGDQAVATNDGGPSVDSHVSMAEIMNAIDDGGTAIANGDIFV